MYFARHIRWSDAKPTLLKDNSFVPGACSGACLPRALHQLLSVCLQRCFWRNKLTRQVKNSYSVDLEHCISDNTTSSYSLLQWDMKNSLSFPANSGSAHYPDSLSSHREISVNMREALGESTPEQHSTTPTGKLWFLGQTQHAGLTSDQFERSLGSLTKPLICESERTAPTAQLQNLFGVNSNDSLTFTVPTT